MKLLLGRTRHVRKAPARAPDGVVLYAIGDVHGRADLLAPLIDALAEDAAQAREAVVIGLGDYVDRGPDSPAVIDQMLALTDHPAITLRALRGNHEQALLDFLDDAETGASWARYGGAATLAAYGAPAPQDLSDMRAWRDTREAFAAALPARHLAFLQGLALSHARGDYLFVHAGVRPSVALGSQFAGDLLWIREPFLDCDRPLDLMVVHGHTPAPDVHADHRRIGLDTGAHASGVLSACRLEGAERRFIQARAGPKGVEIRFIPA